MQTMSEALKKIFAEYFSGYVYPDEKADDEIQKLGALKEDYFRKAKSIVESEVWKNEFRGMTRHFMEQLAFRAKAEKNWTEQDCYRLSIIFLQEFDKRLRNLAILADSPHRKIQKQFDKEKTVRVQ